MLPGVLLSGSVLFSLTAFWLWRNVRAADQQTRRALLTSPGSGYLWALAGCLTKFVDDTLLPAANGKGLRELELRYREHQDPYRTVGELLDDLARKALSGPTLPVDALVKGTYQAGYTLGIPLPRLDPVLAVLIEAAKAAPSSRPIARVATVAPGDLVEARTMVAVNFGPRVLYPLGVICYDAKDQVLSRARVICA